MDFSTVCRTCLGSENLSSIFDDNAQFSIDVYRTTGLMVDMNDGLPQNMCMFCVTKVQDIMRFRELCKVTEAKLLDIKSELFRSSINEKTHRNDSPVLIKVEEQKILKTENNLVFTKEDLNVSNNDNVFNDAPDIVDDDNDFLHTLDSNSDVQNFENNKNENSLKVPCQFCDTQVEGHKLDTHVKAMHGDQFKCTFCKRELGNKEVLLKHIATCRARKSRQKYIESSRILQECDVCHKRMQKGSLRAHKAVQHGGLGPVCEHCGKRFGNKIRLTEHCRAKHGYEKLKCASCDFETASEVSMQNHERRHRGEKPFVCESCGAKFHAAYLLTQHKQSHRTERSYKCESCPATFKVRNSLHLHKMSCHSDSLYKCAMCSRSYRSRQYVVKHIRHMHQYRGVVPRLQRLNKDENYELET